VSKQLLSRGGFRPLEHSSPLAASAARFEPLCRVLCLSLILSTKKQVKVFVDFPLFLTKHHALKMRF